MTYYVGLMSGTSMDGIDAILVDLHQLSPCRLDVVHYLESPFPSTLKAELLGIISNDQVALSQLGKLDTQLGALYADTVLQLLDEAKVNAQDIAAIGCHGQTVWHQPNTPHAFSMQIGDPNTLAERTGITTVTDVRRRDMAAGGQGAPFAPAFHHAMWAKEHQTNAVVNIGGFANITLLDGLATPTGFDTGPGNALMDAWIHQHQQLDYDHDGQWAASGQVHQPLLDALLADPYFAQTGPKSTGREYFNIDWLRPHLVTLAEEHRSALLAEHVQRTLLELTAQTIANAAKNASDTLNMLAVCGGGAHNALLMARIQAHLPNTLVTSTADIPQQRLASAHVEAALMAWLAATTLAKQPCLLKTVTGATRNTIAGGVYFA